MMSCSCDAGGGTAPSPDSEKLGLESSSKSIGLDAGVCGISGAFVASSAIPIAINKTHFKYSPNPQENKKNWSSFPVLLDRKVFLVLE